MQAIYHRPNDKSPWTLQWERLDVNDPQGLHAELVMLAKLKKTGKLVCVGSAHLVPSSVWDMRTLDCWSILATKPCKYYLTNYKLITRNGKRFWAKHDPRQLTLKTA